VTHHAALAVDHLALERRVEAAKVEEHREYQRG
jgi:hypothetical protein